MTQKLNKNGKPYNVTVTALFENTKFGEDSYISKPLTEEDYENLMKIRPGDSLLLKSSQKTTSKGNKYSFLEILPPKESI